ncbi:iron chaperone [Microbacterium sp. NIBRBAC000506063]|uniref:iron chaperone n=1 Tax=Microbacterium sp. NIBRBAC000506063 TaxID=2734618 RepID=UPI001BB7CB17|nr:hypothetical protein [Microbacterium sp. NIBRBAC000506063]QTV79151.1 hypothetical protein KAE78_08675 [Microbacterium sp. NIBRBAC000506063]
MADKNDGFSDFEKAAMKERAKELREAAKLEKNRAAGEKALLEKVAEMPDADRVLAEGFHALVSRVAPDLMPKTWYSMPAYARDGKVVTFFQGAAKFEARYATVGFNDAANLDDGVLWPVSFAITAWNDEVEAQLAAVLEKAIS